MMEEIWFKVKLSKQKATHRLRKWTYSYQGGRVRWRVRLGAWGWHVHTALFKINHQQRPAAAAKLLQSCPTLCDPTDGSPPGSPVPGILQARTLEWVAISFSNAWKWKVQVKSLSHVWLLATPWTAAYQAPPSMDFSGKSTGVGCHCSKGNSAEYSLIT